MRRLAWLVLILIGAVGGLATAEPVEAVVSADSSVSRDSSLECAGLVLKALPGGRAVTVGTITTGIPPRFQATEFVDLSMVALFRQRGKSLPDELEVTVFTPRGFVYQKWEVPVAAPGDSVKETERRLVGYPFPVPVSRAEVAIGNNGANLAVPLPSLLVGGTAIVSSGLYGLWSVSISSAKLVEPCRLRFQLNQGGKSD